MYMYRTAPIQREAIASGGVTELRLKGLKTPYSAGRRPEALHIIQDHAAEKQSRSSEDRGQ